MFGIWPPRTAIFAVPARSRFGCDGVGRRISTCIFALHVDALWRYWLSFCLPCQSRLAVLHFHSLFRSRFADWYPLINLGIEVTTNYHHILFLMCPRRLVVNGSRTGSILTPVLGLWERKFGSMLRFTVQRPVLPLISYH